MRISVRLFASLADVAGARTLELDLPAASTAGALWPAAVAACPALGRAPQPLVAVNLEYARPEAPVREADEVAFLPPVSGG